jgi:hypothetical protein
MYVPKIGSYFYFDGVNWIVAAVGEERFVHKAKKGIFCIVNLNELDCILVIIREREFKIIVDPSIPSVKINNVEFIKNYGKSGKYALLEYDMTIN